jgi:hypothetical protein
MFAALPREMNAMTSTRALALAAALAIACAGGAHAQQPWPDSQPQGQSAWPSAAPQPQPQAPPQAGWPSSAPAAQPQQPWPAAAPAGPGPGPAMGGPGPMGGGMAGPPPTAVQQECMTQFTALRSEVEKRGIAAKTASEKKASREEMCQLVKAYGAAETKWIKFAEIGITKCGIPQEIVKQLKASHARTADGEKKLCAAGPAGGPAAAPTLSDALGGGVSLPAREPEKRKTGGTFDTLTGNPLAR